MISIETARGPARVHDYRAENATKSLVLTHGAGGGVDAGDLQLLAEHLPPQGVSVYLVEMPWRVAGKKLAPRPAIIDECYTSVLTALSLTAPVVGGRSAGARSACRISSEVGARAVLALSFPLHPLGRPEVTRTAELAGVAVPLLVVQGGRDGGHHGDRRALRRPRSQGRQEGSVGAGRRLGSGRRGRLGMVGQPTARGSVIL